MKTRGLILTLSSLLLTGCVYGSNSKHYVLTAKELDNNCQHEELSLADGGHRYSYLNVYNDGADNFVFDVQAYFQSTNGVPGSVLSLTKIEGFEIYGLDELDEETSLEPYEFDSDKNDSDIEEYRFNLAGYYNFKITNVSPSDNVLGVMEFWS